MTSLLIGLISCGGMGIRQSVSTAGGGTGNTITTVGGAAGKNYEQSP